MRAAGPESAGLRPIGTALRFDLLLVCAGLAAMYVPTLDRVLREVWNKPAQVHGPIILALSLWLMFRRRGPSGPGATRLAAAAGWALLLFAVLLYAAGRSQQILVFEIGSLPFVLAAAILIRHGTRMLRRFWFPLFFMLFMVPLPEAVVATLTMPMKMAVSAVTEFVLHGAGYPIGRQGVVLQAGPYQLLVADACAGLQTVLMLEAMGLFYLNVTTHPAPLRNILLAVLIVPISFTANVTRVITLTLVTYHFGDAAGQGFLHRFAGMVLFLSALMLIFAADTLLQAWAARRGRAAGEPAHA
jgi:exosortase B